MTDKPFTIFDYRSREKREVTAEEFVGDAFGKSEAIEGLRESVVYSGEFAKLIGILHRKGILEDDEVKEIVNVI